MEASTEQRTEGRDAEERDEREGGRDGGKTLTGRVEEVQGVVIEVAFPDDDLPDIYTALEIVRARVPAGLAQRFERFEVNGTQPASGDDPGSTGE